MKRIKLIYYISLAVFVLCGILFVNVSRYSKTAGIVENLKDKTIIFYSSNHKRIYLNSHNIKINDMEMLCLEGVSYLKEGGLNPFFLRITEGSDDIFTQSYSCLKKSLKKDIKYVLLDISRGQTKHGERYMAGKNVCCPISIIISKKSKSSSDSLLFAGRIKAEIDRNYKTLPVQIVTVDDQDYNQSMGAIGMLIEIGDAANTFEEAKGSLKILSKAIIDVTNQ
ncbi:MAG: stage II sporulation protein P [Clostridiales bacterium]|nr:stage II sporulation protein P [Clostridiales bacterium]